MSCHALLAAPRRLRRASVGMLALCIAAVAGAVDADPPGRIARVNLVEGSGALQVAGADTWSDELLGRPLAAGDRIWIDAGSRAELYVGSNALRLGARTALQLLAVDDQATRLELSAGSAAVRVRTLAAGERFEISTPEGKVDIVEPGSYRLEVDEQGRRAYFAVVEGRADVSSGRDRASLAAGEATELIAGGVPAVRAVAFRSADDLDLWATDLDRRDEQSPAASYVSREVVGYQDLDGYGEWIMDPVYGPVWAPLVAADWAPYRRGYWSWIAPWGLTWIAAEPWGFAPCHYGRWVHVRHGWAWAPGPRDRQRPVYAPALVSWRRDRPPELEARGNLTPTTGWLPLGYNEIYEPPFHASPEYVRAANLSNTHLRHGEVDRYIGERLRDDPPSGGWLRHPVSVAAITSPTQPVSVMRGPPQGYRPAQQPGLRVGTPHPAPAAAPPVVPSSPQPVAAGARGHENTQGNAQRLQAAPGHPDRLP